MILIVNVTEVDLRAGETVGVARGETDSGKPVSFGLDWRIAADVSRLVEEQGSVPCEVERWQVLGV